MTTAASSVLPETEIRQYGVKVMTSLWRYRHFFQKLYIFRKYLYCTTSMQKGGVIACFRKILDRGGSFTPPQQSNVPKKAQQE